MVVLGGVQTPFEVSGADKLCTLSLVLADGSWRQLARSYDGNAWEARAASPRLSFSCSGSTCNSLLPAVEAGAALVLEGYASPGASAEAARFLQQASFGPSKASISALQALGGPVAWVRAELARPASLHRSYFRERVNPRVLASSPAGRPRRACESGSRWRAYALRAEDVGRLLSVSGSSAPFTLSVGGVAVAEVASVNTSAALEPLYICSVADGLGGAVTYGAGCAGKLANPAVSFAGGALPGDGAALLVSERSAELVELTPAVAGAALLPSPPGDCAEPAAPGALAFLRRSGDPASRFWISDPRLVTLDNTVESPAVGGADELGGTSCANVPKTFLNAASCVSGVPACGPARYAPALFRLDEDAVRAFFQLDGLFVYAIAGLRTDDVSSPCGNYRSRWALRPAETCAAATPGLEATTAASLAAVLAASSDANALVRDINAFQSGLNTKTCKATAATVGARLAVAMRDGSTQCFEHVHPDLLSVFDLTAWARSYERSDGHPGNAVALANGRANPIQRRAIGGSALLVFPAWHPLQRWKDSRRGFTYVGRLGDPADFAELPAVLQSAGFAARVGSVALARGALGEVCGSPGEVASKPALGHRASVDGPLSSPPLQDSRIYSPNVKVAVWMQRALAAPDQLRQRVAWALSQILVVSSDLVDSDNNNEAFLAFYDILVRNALGNYRDVLREVAFSPVMGEMLTTLGSKSLSFQFNSVGQWVYPDEK
jgi:hypothetical protein